MILLFPLAIIFAGLFLLSLFSPVYWIFRFIHVLTSNTNKEKINTIKDQNLKGFPLIFFFLTLLSCVLLIFLNNKATSASIQMTINTADAGLNPYKIISESGIITFGLFFILGLISFGVLVVHGTELSPIVYILCNCVLIINMYFAIMLFTQVLGSDPNNTILFYIGAYQYLGLIFMYLTVMTINMKSITKRSYKGDIAYENKWLNKLYIFFIKINTKPFMLLLISLPLLLIIQFILILFGQKPDEFIRMFFDTSSYNYSMVPAPPPILIFQDSHYLCTVSARGHKKFVKPLRSGIRGGKRILVNRQLLIANAFEHILEEHTPKTHKFIRYIYDKYGYPLSKKINTKFSADITYVIMKPLEWFFLFILYCVDKNPENRINIQYSQLRK